MYELLFSFKFYWQFNFLRLPDPFFLGLCLLWLIWKQFFSCLVVLLQSLAGVKSVFAKINLYDLLSCSIFRFLPALWEMQQAESSFLCRIINSVAFLVHMFQVRQNGELYLSLLHPSKSWAQQDTDICFSYFPRLLLDISAGWIQPVSESEDCGDLFVFCALPLELRLL